MDPSSASTQSSLSTLVKATELDYFRKMSGMKVFAYGKTQLFENNLAKVGVTECTMSSDSSLFAVATKAGLLMLFSSASLKLLALNSDFKREPEDDKETNTMAETSILKLIGNESLLHLSASGSLRLYATDRLDTAPEVEAFLAAAFGASIVTARAKKMPLTKKLVLSPQPITKALLAESDAELVMAIEGGRLLKLTIDSMESADHSVIEVETRTKSEIIFLSKAGKNLTIAVNTAGEVVIISGTTGNQRLGKIKLST